MGVPSLVDVCLAAPGELYRQLLAPELYTLSSCARGPWQPGRCLPLRHLRLGRQGGGGGRDALVLEVAPWGDIESLHATHMSLYAVQAGLQRALSMRELRLELFFEEPFRELLPEGLACWEGLEVLELQNCYPGVLAGLAATLLAGGFPRLHSLRLRGSPKGAAAKARGLRWPPAPGGLPPGDAVDGELDACAAAPALAAAVTATPSIRIFEVHGVAAFGATRSNKADGWSSQVLRAPSPGPIATIAGRPGLRRFALTDCSLLGHWLLCEVLAALVAGNPGLEVLNLAPNPLCSEPFDNASGLGQAAGGLLAGLGQLRSLRLAWCELREEGAAEIRSCLEAARCVDDLALREVDLSHNGIPAAAAHALKAKLLMRAPRLRLLLV
mmetsp:Transcript_11528/g.34770  ORF Transcript_11528/g.34770 Transcript_11528/m.34770 type:complete len:384 (+) Transcript_11528:39-1190(+)